MTYVLWAGGVIVRIPDAWGPDFRIGDVPCKRAEDGTITAFVGEKWRRVEQWNLTGQEAVEAAKERQPPKELSA